MKVSKASGCWTATTTARSKGQSSRIPKRCIGALTFAEPALLLVEGLCRVERDDFARHERLQEQVPERLVRLVELQRFQFRVALLLVRIASRPPSVLLLPLPARASLRLTRAVVVRFGLVSAPATLRSRSAHCHSSQRFDGDLVRKVERGRRSVAREDWENQLERVARRGAYTRKLSLRARAVS